MPAQNKDTKCYYVRKYYFFLQDSELKKFLRVKKGQGMEKCRPKVLLTSSHELVDLVFLKLVIPSKPEDDISF